MEIVRDEGRGSLSQRTCGASHFLGSLLRVSFFHRATSRPHSFEKGRGGCNYVLASEGAEVVLVEPTSLRIGEGLASGSFHFIAGELGW